MPYGGEMLLLNFEIDENYIDKELKRNKFINKDKYKKQQKCNSLLLHIPGRLIKKKLL